MDQHALSEFSDVTPSNKLDFQKTQKAPGNNTPLRMRLSGLLAFVSLHSEPPKMFSVQIGTISLAVFSIFVSTIIYTSMSSFHSVQDSSSENVVAEAVLLLLESGAVIEISNFIHNKGVVGVLCNLLRRLTRARQNGRLFDPFSVSGVHL